MNSGFRRFSFLFFIVFCAQKFPVDVCCEIHRENKLVYLSPQQAGEFLSRAKKIVTENVESLRLECELSTGIKDRKIRSCEVFLKNLAENKWMVNAKIGVDLYNSVFDGENGLFNNNRWESLIFSPRDFAAILLCIKECSYIGPARVSGRSSQQFLYSTGLESDAIHSLRLSIDNKLLTVIQVDYFNDKGKVVRRMGVSSFKSFGELWLPKIIEICDFQGRNREKLEIISANFSEK